MASLTDLFPEILEEVILKLDVEDVISLGSTCTKLARIVGKERLWMVILSKTELVKNGRVWEDRVRTITTFLSSQHNSDSILAVLNQIIYKRYPAISQGDYEDITVSFPSSTQLHSVSGLGLELVALTGRRRAKHLLHKVRLAEVPSSLLLPLASLEKEQMTELVVGDVNCTTEEEGRALVSLMESCSTWYVALEDLSGEVGEQTWEGVGRQVAEVGRLVRVRAGREVVGRGRREDLLAVWRNTEVRWGVGSGQRIRKRDGEEEGWKKIEEMIQ